MSLTRHVHALTLVAFFPERFLWNFRLADAPNTKPLHMRIGLPKFYCLRTFVLAKSYLIGIGTAQIMALRNTSIFRTFARLNTSIKRTAIYQRYHHSVPYVFLKEWHKGLRRRIKLSQYLGNEYCCPVCDTHLCEFKRASDRWEKTLRQYGYVYPIPPMGTYCPACDANDRDRLFALYLDNQFRSFDKQRRYRLVDFGPAPSLQKKLKSYAFLSYRSADLFRKSADDQIDITDMRPYVDNSIDILICSHILEHVPNDRKAMKELYRVLRPGGFGIVIVPIVNDLNETHEDPAINSPEMRWKYYGLDDHVRQYGKRDFVERLTAAGFNVDQIGVDYFGGDVFKRADVSEDSFFYVVKK
jgi:SAM-dependent methyltransferase